MRDAVERFPFVLLCGAVGSGCAITAIHSGIDSALVGNCWRLALTVALGLPLFFSLRLLRERATRLTRIPIEWLGVPLLAGRSTPLGSSSLLLAALIFFPPSALICAAGIVRLLAIQSPSLPPFLPCDALFRRAHGRL